MKSSLTPTRRRFLAVSLFLQSCWLLSALAVPVVTNVRASQRAGTKLVEVLYDLAGTGPMTVAMEVSLNDGTSYTLQAKTATGAFGSGVSAGANKVLVWNAGVDFNNQWSPQTKVRMVVTESASTSSAPPGFVEIPAGSFQMGNSFPNEAAPPELPVHTVSLDAFYLEATEVTTAQWNLVVQWAADKGYDLGTPSIGQPVDPISGVTWYNAVKWCNARSEMEGLLPCYYTWSSKTSAYIYRSGSVDLTSDFVLRSANGYRLPSEAEWEKAARGGIAGKRFPWGDNITHSEATYYSTSSSPYDISPTSGWHPAGFLLPVGSFPANGYGLHDICGNVAEWVWDRYGSEYYGSSPVANPPGPATGTERVIRGGGYGSSASGLRVSSRVRESPSVASNAIGFRTARNH